jgi:hypothetical protein
MPAGVTAGRADGPSQQCQTDRFRSFYFYSFYSPALKLWSTVFVSFGPTVTF